MAVIGSTLGIPKPSQTMSLNVLVTLLGLAAAAGLIWVVVDYVRMLVLYRKMVCEPQQRSMQ